MTKQSVMWPFARLMVVLASLVLAACGNGTNNDGEQTVDFDALDVDFDTLDVDINGIDIAAYQDVLKQDTVGSDVQPDVPKQDVPKEDVQADIQEDTQADIQADTGPDIQPECSADADCDDKLACTDDTCANGKCTHSNNTATCDDGNACTAGDACKDGACLPGAATSCDDGNPCTTDSCDTASGCTQTASEGDCTDGSACTLGDTCKDGACLPGATTDCNDENPCTTDSCDPASGCVHDSNTQPCEDGSACTIGDVCAGGACLPGAVTSCDDGDICTDDACDTTSGCQHSNNTASCDDGNACTLGDACGEGTCSGTAKNCADENACTADSCDGGECLHTPLDGAPCDDGNFCTENDACAKDLCQGQEDECSQGEDVCVLTFCDPASGCADKASTANCDDGDPCTQVDACKDFVCVGSDVTDCNDDDACSDDSCAKGLGCAHTATNCDDANPCTTDSCDMATGCTHTALPGETSCDDGNACTDGTYCDGSTPPACVGGYGVTCNDENQCTSDACDTKTGCVHLPLDVTCDDGAACTVGDTCIDAYCVGGLVAACDDGNPCTTDACSEYLAQTAGAGGCMHYAAYGATCDDGDPCTVIDICSGTECMGGDYPTCDDNNVCTIDLCNTIGPPGCTHLPDPQAMECYDGNACTLNDMCTSNGECIGVVTDCTSDGDPCTLDVCDPAAGCMYNATCDDGDPCTADSCNPDQGTCSHTPLSVFRDSFVKGNAAGWTLGEEWQIGSAKQGPAGDMPPGDPAFGHSKDGQIAGVVLGGNAKRALHGYYYLTSPVMDTTALSQPTLEFWRWLISDESPYMDNVIEAWDGAAWQVLWQQSYALDTGWNRQIYDLSSVSNPQLQIRIGFAIGDTGVYSAASWNLDDVVVGELGACVQPMQAAAPPQKPAGSKRH